MRGLGIVYRVYTSPENNDLIKILEDFLCKPNTVVACIGTELRSDDAVGVLVYNLIKETANAVLCLYGLENCVDELMKVCAENMLIVDGVVNNAPAGSIIVASVDKISENYMATTHNIPLSMTLAYLRNHGCARNVLVLGIVVENLAIGDSMTPVVEKTARKLSYTINKLVRQCLKQSTRPVS